MVRRTALALIALAGLSLAVPQGIPQADAEEASGEKVSNFTLRDINNQEVSLDDFENQVVLLSFWATWCAPCMVELPHVQRIYDTYKADGFVVLAISADDARSASKVKPMVKSKGWTFPVLLDKQTKVVSERNPGKTLPYTELLDHTHSVVYKHQGYNAGDEVHLEEKVKEAVAARKAALGE